MLATSLPPTSNRIAYVQASWHTDILEHGREAFVARLDTHRVARANVDFHQVPGAFEIPLFARRLAQTRRYGAIVGAALVVDGGIYRHDFVAGSVVDALMRVQLEQDVPVFSMVLTPHHYHEHDTHATFFAGHFAVKGTELADAVVHQLGALAQLRNLSESDRHLSGLAMMEAHA
jgi:6,7-dimethyl-8-ribityllumazine synthase